MLIHENNVLLKDSSIAEVSSLLILKGIQKSITEKFFNEALSTVKNNEILEEELIDALNILSGSSNPNTKVTDRGIYFTPEKPRILFLDLDGIINKQNNIKGHENVYLFETKLEDVFVKQFARYVDKLCKEFNLKIVISSSWRKEYCLSELRYILKYMGIEAPLIDVTIDSDIINNTNLKRFSRRSEIYLWLSKNTTCTYFILDDMEEAMDLKDRLNCYLVPSEDGFNKLHYENCRSLLKEKYKENK